MSLHNRQNAQTIVNNALAVMREHVKKTKSSPPQYRKSCGHLCMSRTWTHGSQTMHLMCCICRHKHNVIDYRVVVGGIGVATPYEWQ
jgi:hypothetical protein